jgi:hypothetical protein
MKHFWNLFSITGALISLGLTGSGEHHRFHVRRVTDGTGSGIVNATVTVTETAQNVATVRDIDEGNFHIAGLMPGNYRSQWNRQG